MAIVWDVPPVAQLLVTDSVSLGSVHTTEDALTVALQGLVALHAVTVMEVGEVAALAAVGGIALAAAIVAPATAATNFIFIEIVPSTN